MRRFAARHDIFLPLTLGLALPVLAAGPSFSPAQAQTAPETLRINVEPATPGVRSITVNKRYRPIISRDDQGVVIDTMGSDNTLPPCNVKLEVTLENSRVLHRDADICSGGALVVDVDSAEKPGAVARVIGSDSGFVPGPALTSAQETAVSSAPSSAPVEANGEDTGPAQLPAEDLAETVVTTDPRPGGLQPLDAPVLVPEDFSGTASLPGQLETIIEDRLNLPSAPGPANARPVTVAPSDLRRWQAQPGSQTGALSILQHSVPQTGNMDFSAQCGTQSGFAAITFQQAPVGLMEGMPITVFVSAGDFAQSYSALGSSANNQAGVSFPEVTLEMTDPIWSAMISQSELSVAVEGMPTYSVSLDGSAAPVRLFAATCAIPQQIVSDEAFGVPMEDPGADLSCSEIGRVRSIEAERPGQIVFRNASQEVLEVSWVDYRGDERPYAQLAPGQILEQQTFVSHAWTVRGTGGQCRGVYISRTPYRDVVLTGGPISQPGALGGPLGLPGAALPSDPFPAGPVPPADLGGLGQSVFPQQAASANVTDYLCTSGIDLNVVFSPNGQTATVSEMGYGAVTLQRQGSANTFYFESQGHVLKGQLQTATWSRPGLRDVFCARR